MENENLRAWNDTPEGDGSSEKIAAEWKQKIDKLEGQWTERLNSVGF